MNVGFFDAIRPIFGGKLSQSQVDGVNTIIDAWREHGSNSNPQLAYVLGTVKHETAATMQPIYEYGPKSYFDKYEPVTKIGHALGNTHKGDGYRFRGAGYVQLTGRANFKKAGDKIGVDLTAHPEKAIEPNNAAKIAIIGMRDGWFTGKKLSDYITPAHADFRSARRIINGLDKTDVIAQYAKQFDQALFAAAAQADSEAVKKG